MNYFIIDTETTGLPDYKNKIWPKAISIALIHGIIINGSNGSEMEIYLEKEWYINDWVDEMSEETENFLGISKNFIKKRGLPFEQVKNEILNYIDKYPMKTFVAHNSEFDMNVLQTCGLDLSNFDWFCTMKFGLRFYDKFPKLKELATLFKIPFDESSLHTALYDAQICSYILYCLKTKTLNIDVKEYKILSLRNRDVIISV